MLIMIMMTTLLSLLLSRRSYAHPETAAADACSNENEAAATLVKVGSGRVPAGAYYSEYRGHTVEHLERVRELLQETGCDEFVYLMGDSSLDNKHWLFLLDAGLAVHGSKEQSLLTNNYIVSDAVNGYENVLDPPRMVMDVCYWMNKLAAERLKTTSRKKHSRRRVCTIMSAVEESTVASRNRGRSLLPQDAFIARRLRSRDSLVISMGGNDMALKPSEATVRALHSLARSPRADIEDGTAPGFSHVFDIFHARVGDILRRVTRTTAPRLVVVCGLYFLDESNVGSSWADPILRQLGYDRDPSTVQAILRSVYKHMEEAGFLLPSEETTVKLFPMFEALDGKSSEDYLQRVEPSIEGGRKIASGLLELIL